MKFDNIEPTKCCEKQDLKIDKMINWDNWIYICSSCGKEFLRRHHFWYDLNENTVIPIAILKDDEGNEFKIVLGVGRKYEL